MNKSTQMQTISNTVQINFMAAPYYKEESSLYLSDFSNLIQGIVEIHDCLVAHAVGGNANLQVKLLRIQMNSPMQFDLGIFKDIADAFVKLLKIPIELIKGKKEIEQKEVEIEIKREEANMLKSQSQHQQSLQLIEIQTKQIELDKKRMELFAYGHEKTKDVLESLSSLNTDPHAAQILALHSARCIRSIAKISESNLQLSIIDIKPIYRASNAVSIESTVNTDDSANDEDNDEKKF